MSITRLATRLLTTRALAYAETLAEDRIRDSSIVNLESAIAGSAKPIVLVYTDDSEFRPTGRTMLGGQGTTTIVLILAVAGSVRLENGETTFLFPTTDATVEMSLDILERQIQVALSHPDNPWAQLWQKIVTNVGKWQSRRGGSTKEGARFGARQIIIEVETIFDPVIGAEPEGPWAELLAAIEADTSADFAGIAGPLRALIKGGELLPDWKRNMATFAIPRESLRGMGLAPFQFHTDGGDTDQPATFTQIEVYEEGKPDEGISTDNPAVGGEP